MLGLRTSNFPPDSQQGKEVDEDNSGVPEPHAGPPMDGLQREVANLKSQLRAFEKKFASKHGRTATREDVSADVEASGWFRRYEVLKLRATPRIVPDAPSILGVAQATISLPDAARRIPDSEAGPMKGTTLDVTSGPSALRKGEVDREMLRYLVKASEPVLTHLREAIEGGRSLRAKRILGLAIALRGRQNRIMRPISARRKTLAKRPGVAKNSRTKRRRGKGSGESSGASADEYISEDELGDLGGFIASGSDEADTGASDEEEDEAGSEEELDAQGKLSRKGLKAAVAKFLAENISHAELTLKELRKGVEKSLGYSLKDRKREFTEAAKLALISDG